MKKEEKFQVSMTVPYVYNFMMKNAYQGFKGIAGILVSVGAFVLYLMGFGKDDDFTNMLLIIIPALMVLNPIYLYYKAYKQVKLNPSFHKPLNYIVNEVGITVGQGTEEGTIPWDNIVRVVETKKSTLVYISRKIAYIFPKEELKDQYEPFKALIRENVEASRLTKMK